MEFNIKLSNRQILNGMIISPGEHTKAVIIMVHGLGEHIQRYLAWAGLFKNEGIAFIGLDLPGHGRSDGRRGSISSYFLTCLLYTSPSPRDRTRSRMPSSA